MMTNNCPHISNIYFDQNKLARENREFKSTTGISKNNRSLGFIPAFYDSESGRIYLSCNKDGTRAAIHILEGLPEELILERDSKDNVVSIKPSVMSGFVKNDRFYTREQAAKALH